MTPRMSIEAHVADSASAWRAASRNSDAAARETVEREFADVLERWIAELLETDAEWPLRGRWFDGLVFQECREEENERFCLSGYIWSIDQAQWPFRASIQLSADGLAAFDVRFGEGKPSDEPRPRKSRRWDLRSVEPEWGFQFVRNG